MEIIGIDLGTTNSLGAVWKDGACQLIANALGDFLTPSVVSIEKNHGNILVGKSAKERLISHPTYSAANFKQFMGTDKEFNLGDKRFRAEELSSFILRQLKEDAAAYLGEEVSEAVISVPAYFNDQQRTATKHAGQLAGLKVDRIINEPSAAALAYKGSHDMDGVYLVVDFGGGTLDISVVEMFQNIVDINGIVGDNHLGGNDIDKAILDAFLEQNTSLATKLSESEHASLLKQCEQAKIVLTSAANHVMVYQKGKKAYSMELSNQRLSEICHSLLNRIQTLLEGALRSAGCHISSVRDVILVGGSCQMPVIEQYIEYITKKKPMRGIDPSQVVAYGAGLVSGIKARDSEIQDLILTDVCPFTLGIKTKSSETGNVAFFPIIQRNSALPVSIERYFVTIGDDQKTVSVKIYQGESRNIYNNLFLGEINLEVPPCPAGEVGIDVRFTYDINGILEVDVSCPATGQAKHKLVISNKGLREEEIAAHVARLQQFKISPREQAENRHVIAMGERLFEETSGVLRQQIGGLTGKFINLVETGKNVAEIEKMKAYLLAFFSKVTSSFDDGLVDFPDFDEEKRRDENL